MSFTFVVPTADADHPVQVSVKPGEMIFVLGANGTGKSSLLQHFNVSVPSARRITAHRQNWLDSGAAAVTGAQRKEFGQYVANFDQSWDARWRDSFNRERTQLAVYDLIAAENSRSRKIAAAVDANNQDQINALAEKGGVVTRLNHLLRLSNLDIEIAIEESGEITAVRSGSAPYSISKLSDGERNAILIGANILTAADSSILLIDEPERHLHRSIISPLLSSLLRERSDCAFVVSTHEPMLPVDNPEAGVILARGCTYDGDAVAYFDVDVIKGSANIDDELKAAILGERRRILFVEGVEHSLDKPLYSLLFPKVSVVPRASCRDVENAVKGIRNAEELAWVRAFGLVDDDSSTAQRQKELLEIGVAPIRVYSVESIYYHPAVQRLAALGLADLIGGDADSRIADALSKAMAAIARTQDHLASRIAEKAARAHIFTLLPQKGDISDRQNRHINIDYGALLDAELVQLNSLVRDQDLVSLLQRYPIRESGALDAIAKALGYGDRAKYESAVIQLLLKDAQVLADVRELLGPIPSELTS